MVRHSLPFGVHIPTNDPFYSKDSLSFLIIVYSAKHRGPARAHGAPNLLDKILRDATTYFLVIFTGQLLAIFFVIFAPVRDRPTDLCLLPPDQLQIGTDSTFPCKVSNHPKYFGEGGSDGTYRICSAMAV